MQKFTRINFDLNSDDLLKNRSLIHSAITTLHDPLQVSQLRVTADQPAVLHLRQTLRML